jgi:prepilin-type processing-associated H-X9-DG protein
VVVAILGILCAILFPVFSAAKGEANRAVCITNLKTLSEGAHLYAGDYDDRMMPVNQMPDGTGNSRNDRTWVQNLLPYIRTFSVFRCPSDYSNRPQPEATFDQDLVPGDTDSQYYTASLRSDYGYNFQNLAPILLQDLKWTAQPKTEAQIAESSKTLLYVESTWALTSDGEPTGGGNWLVVPPCRYFAGSHFDTFTGSVGGNVPVYTTALGWSAANGESGDHPSDVTTPSASPVLYGNAWPRHNGHMNVAFVDGHVRSITPAGLGAGCQVLNAWTGEIFDRGLYLWDTY